MRGSEAGLHDLRRLVAEGFSIGEIRSTSDAIRVTLDRGRLRVVLEFGPAEAEAILAASRVTAP